jgi:hypothetical protein
VQAALCALSLVCAGGAAEAANHAVEWRVSSSPEGVHVVNKLPSRAFQLALGSATDPPPEAGRIRVLERGLTYSHGMIHGDHRFGQVTLLLAPDDRDVNAKYPLAVQLSRRAYLVYAPYLILQGRAKGAVLRASGAWRLLGRGEAQSGFLIVGAEARKGDLIGATSAITTRNISPVVPRRRVHYWGCSRF